MTKPETLTTLLRAIRAGNADLAAAMARHLAAKVRVERATRQRAAQTRRPRK